MSAMCQKRTHALQQLMPSLGKVLPSQLGGQSRTFLLSEETVLSLPLCFDLRSSDIGGQADYKFSAWIKSIDFERATKLPDS